MGDAVLITDAEEWHAVFGDGHSWTEFQLEPDGRIRINGYTGEYPEEWTPMHCTTHSASTAEEMSELLQRMAAHVRERL
jgi:hypothetical protein